MNKKLIALAVAGACVVPEAMAQTANPVTLYGRAYVTFESVEAKGTVGTVGPLVRRNRVVDQSSLLGVRGTEDLGGGLKAFFQLETQWKADQNDTTFAARNSAVGLQGNWGSILMGRWDTPLKVGTNTVDPFGDLTIGAMSGATGGAGVGNVNASNVFDRREQNVVQYWSPSWAGLAVRLSYMANEGKTSTACTGNPANTSCNPRSEGGSLTYTGGPIFVGYAYHQLRDIAYGGFTVTATTPPAFTFVTPILPKHTANTVFGTFTFGPIKLGAVYEKMKRGNVTTTATTAGTIVGFSDQKAWMGNVIWTFGNSQLIYQYTKAKDGGETIIPSATVLQPAQPNCTINVGAYQYNFSRRTFFLGQYVRIKNSTTSTCNFGTTDGRLPITAGQNPQGFSLGLRHIF